MERVKNFQFWVPACRKLNFLGASVADPEQEFYFSGGFGSNDKQEKE
mgnify:CR=1 FL=1